MSKHQSDRKEDIQSAGQTDRVTERQNDCMADSRAAKLLKSPLLFNPTTQMKLVRTIYPGSTVASAEVRALPTPYEPPSPIGLMNTNTIRI